MNFESRIKKEMTEGVVRAILEDAQYRVVDYGIEKTVREVAHISAEDYIKLKFAKAVRKAPDLLVMTESQDEQCLVEIKYREIWDKSLLVSLEEQIKLFEELILVSVNANPPNVFGTYYPSTYLRCCRMRWKDGKVEVQLRIKKEKFIHYWRSYDDIVDDVKTLWWAMSPLDEVFPLLKHKGLDSNKTLDKAVKAISGILTLPDPIGGK